MFVQVDESWFEGLHFLLIDRTVAADDDSIPGVCLVGGCAIHGNDPGSFLRPDGIGSETFTVGDVIDLYLLVLVYSGLIQKTAVDGAGTIIMKLRMGYAGLVEFCFQDS